jgi:hypothetical protein
MTITFDSRRWAFFAAFVLLTAVGLPMGMFPAHVGQAWVGGLLCGFGLSAFAAFLLTGRECHSQGTT